MNRKEKPIWRRVLLTISVFAFLGAGGFIYFSGLTFASGIVAGLALASIGAPVVSEGGGILEILSGVFEALREGLMGVVDIITGIFNL